MEDENDFEKFLYGKKEGSSRKNERVNIHKSQSIKKEEGDQNDEKELKDELDLQIEDLSAQIMLSSLPNPGNLRSSKKKDVKMRLRCLNAMLQQRQKDMQFRESHSERFRRLEMDKQIQ